MLPGRRQQLHPEADRIPRVRRDHRDDWAGTGCALNRAGPGAGAVGQGSTPFRVAVRPSIGPRAVIPSEAKDRGRSRTPRASDRPADPSLRSGCPSLTTRGPRARPHHPPRRRCCPSLAAPLAAQSAVDIPYERFILPNGLTLLVHEDHKAPIVAVNIWYHVGSKNERPGRTGFAHLFEHLMFNGSEHYNNDTSRPLERVGATDLNGTTNEDRTNYFENVPTSALDLALWLESDRMGHLVGRHRPGEARRAARRGAEREARRARTSPTARCGTSSRRGIYPANHPYSWTVIGSMEDLDAAKLDDVKDWFQTYYGPANAVLVHRRRHRRRDRARQKVEKYFGDIPSGPAGGAPGARGSPSAPAASAA